MMTKKMIKNLFLLTTLMLSLVGCEKSRDMTPKEEITYKPNFIVLNVSDIEIIDKTDGVHAINSQYTPPLNPRNAIVNWAKHRLRAKGTTGKMQFIINEASFTETQLESQEGKVLSSLKREKNKYDTRYLLTLKLYSDNSGSNKVSEITVEAFSTRTIIGVVSLVEKDKIITNMLQELIDNAEAQLESNIKAYFIG